MQKYSKTWPPLLDYRLHRYVVWIRMELSARHRMRKEEDILASKKDHKTSSIPKIENLWQSLEDIERKGHIHFGMVRILIFKILLFYLQEGASLNRVSVWCHCWILQCRESRLDGESWSLCSKNQSRTQSQWRKSERRLRKIRLLKKHWQNP